MFSVWGPAWNTFEFPSIWPRCRLLHSTSLGLLSARVHFLRSTRHHLGFGPGRCDGQRKPNLICSLPSLHLSNLMNLLTKMKLSIRKGDVIHRSGGFRSAAMDWQKKNGRTRNPHNVTMCSIRSETLGVTATGFWSGFLFMIYDYIIVSSCTYDFSAHDHDSLFTIIITRFSPFNFYEQIPAIYHPIRSIISYQFISMSISHNCHNSIWF